MPTILLLLRLSVDEVPTGSDVVADVDVHNRRAWFRNAAKRLNRRIVLRISLLTNCIQSLLFLLFFLLLKEKLRVLTAYDLPGQRGLTFSLTGI